VALYTAKQLERFALKNARDFVDFQPVMQMKWLRELTLQNIHGMTELPDGLCDLTALVRLSILHQEALTRLPDQIKQLRNLCDLTVSNCGRITRLPESIGQLYMLCSMNLSGCGMLDALPLSLGQLPDLRKIDLSRCGSLDLMTRFECLDGHVSWLMERMRRKYHPPKLLVLVLAARRLRQRHLPDELWTQLILNEYLV
jgi:hypothetical protein